jgi:hypothetical protein
MQTDITYSKTTSVLGKADLNAGYKTLCSSGAVATSPELQMNAQCMLSSCPERPGWPWGRRDADIR